MIAANADMASFIEAKKKSFMENIEKSVPAGAKIKVPGFDALFTEDSYAEFEKIELKSLSYRISDDAVFIGDPDDPANLQLISGSVICDGYYTVSYIFIIVLKAEPEWIPGDINGDGETDNKDVFALFRYLSGSGAEVITAALDCNGDGSVDNKDVFALFKYLSGVGTLSEMPYAG